MPKCTLPDHFVDVPHPPIAPVERLVSRTEEITIARGLDVVVDSVERTALEDAIVKVGALPSVAGTVTLTPGAFGRVGSRRLVCLTDGSTLLEQILQNERTDDAHRFRYVVWNYTSRVARPVSYGVGDFEKTALSPDRTRVRWTYAFALKPDRFPGLLGPLGRLAFRLAFLDRRYAAMMRATLRRQRANAERAGA